jgi:uncharacterized repeat protein (TIGR03803 family)
MHSKQQSCNSLSRTISRTATATLAITIAFVLTVVATQSAQAQNYKLIHNFTGGMDGAIPDAGLTMDTAGNLYGTTCGTHCAAGAKNAGTVFRMSNKGSGWVFTPLYVFGGGNDGADPSARVIIGPDGSLYGPTWEGGEGYGTIFNLKPAAAVSPNIFGGWTETVLYRFSGGDDGANPEAEVVFDQLGNLYGTTTAGGTSPCAAYYSCGVVFKLTPSSGGWAESVIHAFSGNQDGAYPVSSVIFDQAGNLYGTASYGGDLMGCYPFYPGCGTVFVLSPSVSGWNDNTLYTFHNLSDGAFPQSGLIFDPSGNLYGTTWGGGTYGSGTVFELMHSYGGWTLTTLHSFAGSIGPLASLTMDEARNLYGTTYTDGAYGYGNVFKLTFYSGGWTYTSLHDFTGGSDGGSPASSVIFDANGNLYGTASVGGAYGYGVVFEITP